MDIPPQKPILISRRRFGHACAAGLAAAGAAAPFLPSLQAKEESAQNVFDQTMSRFLKDRHIPGGALAVVKDGRLVHARGYGWADRKQNTPVHPRSLFRIASLSKPITATAILQQIEQKQLSLDTLVYEQLNLADRIPAQASLDPRWKQITVQHLLHHTGGWDRDQSFDPMFRSRTICQALHRPDPARPWDVISYMLGQPLDFDPGARYAYSNFGYCLLGRLLESVSAQPYEQLVRASVLAPLGITSMRLGQSRLSLPGEAHYYMPDDETAPSVFHPDQRVPWPYGGFHLEAMDAHGGWIASAVDLVRFMAALSPDASPSLLNPASLSLMHSSPPPPVSRDKDGRIEPVFYGCGWLVRPQGGPDRFNAWHTGSLPGTSTLLVRRGDGISYAALFNQRSANRSRDSQIDPMLYRAADQMKSWPDSNLFESLP